METRILIADRQKMFRAALKRLLRSQRDLIVIGESDSGKELLRLAMDLKPDVILLNYHLRDGSCLEVLGELATKQPEGRPIVLADSMKSTEAVHALVLGARGVLRKDAPVDLLFKCIRCVMAGEYWVDRHAVNELVKIFRTLDRQRLQDEGKETAILSSRELKVVAAIESGLTNPEIAQELHLSERTVKYYLTRIFRKCGVAGRMELARQSLRNKNSRRA
jgi:DNA-binding NarL/FixJ family response regulator